MSVTDVVVVGGGGAGLAAAATAAALGRSVVLLEKNPRPGGTTVHSVGSVSATSTPHQIAAGILDNPADHFEDLRRFAGREVGRDNAALGRLLTEHAPETFRWLLAAGLEFVGPMPEPPHRRPRMHNVLPNSGAFAWHLSRLCRRLGVRIVCDTRVERVCFDGDRAVAVEAVGPGERALRYDARGGIVLAAGDFSASPELKARFASELAARSDPVNPSATGDGIRIGLDCGGEVVNGDHLRGPFLRFVPPPRPPLLTRLPPWRPVTRAMRLAYEHLPAPLLRPVLMRFLTTTLAPDRGLFDAGAALIGRDGQRIPEPRRDPHRAVAAAPGGLGTIVFDDRIAARFSAWPHFVSTAPGVAYAYLDDYRRTRSDLYVVADDVATLAARLGMPAPTLAASLAAHQAELAAADPPLPPFTGTRLHALGPAKAYVVFTNGGLRVSEGLEVLRSDGSPIPGLWAAGSNGQGGQLLEGHGHHLGWAFVSGRLAGRAAALACTTAAAAVQTDA